MRSGLITVSPSGFFQPEAIFARNLFGATPADAVNAVSARIRSFSRRATVVASGSPHELSVTSRYASSSDSGSTSGVTSRKIAKTVCDTVLYRVKSGGKITRAGQGRTALAIDIPECTAKATASKLAAAT